VLTITGVRFWERGSHLLPRRRTTSRAHLETDALNSRSVIKETNRVAFPKNLAIRKGERSFKRTGGQPGKRKGGEMGELSGGGGANLRDRCQENGFGNGLPPLWKGEESPWPSGALLCWAPRCKPVREGGLPLKENRHFRGKAARSCAWSREEELSGHLKGLGKGGSPNQAHTSSE